MMIKRFGKYKEVLLLVSASILICVGVLFIFSQDWNHVEQVDAQIQRQFTNQRQQEEEIRLSDDTRGVTPAPVQMKEMHARRKIEKNSKRRVKRKKYRYIKDCTLTKKVQRKIFDICERDQVSFELVMAVIQRESDWNPVCVSDAGKSVGLMQIQEQWHRSLMDKLKCQDLYDPVQNVTVGVRLLKGYMTDYQDAASALMAYNGGRAYAERHIKSGKVSEYAIEVLKRAEKYERGNGL